MTDYNCVIFISHQTHAKRGVSTLFVSHQYTLQNDVIDTWRFETNVLIVITFSMISLYFDWNKANYFTAIGVCLAQVIFRIFKGLRCQQLCDVTLTSWLSRIRKRTTVVWPIIQSAFISFYKQRRRLKVLSVILSALCNSKRELIVITIDQWLMVYL